MTARTKTNTRSKASAPAAPLSDAPFADVVTPAFRLSQIVCDETAHLGKVAVLYGDPGCGKTHAIEHFLKTTSRPTVFTTATPSPTRKEIFEELIIALTGTCDDMSTTKIRRQCLALLNDVRPIVAVDEAQHLSSLWLQQLRSLHDAGRFSWPLILVGGMGTARRLKTSPELWSRTGLRAEFAPITGDLLLQTLTEFHPVLANTDPSVLRDIDHRYASGNFRLWKNFCEVAFMLLDATSTPDRISPKLARATFAKIGMA